MIFDFYLSYVFDPDLKNHIKVLKFKDDNIYGSINGIETSACLRLGYVSSIYRRSYNDSYSENEHNKLWIFGYVFSTEDYALSLNRLPFKLTASGILNIIKNNPENYYTLLKGSYVLIILREEDNELEIITDQLNVLPLYYAFKGKRLIISSNTSLMLKSDWIDKTIDNLALVMQSLFDYMLGDHYFFKGIHRCENATVYTFSGGRVEKKGLLGCKQLISSKIIR